MGNSPHHIHTDDGRVFIDMPDDGICASCGACCRHFRISFYQGELDCYPGGFVPTDLAVSLTPFLVCMKGTEQGGKPCIALQADNRCAIYTKRPTPCREFPPYMADGSLNPKCVELRRAEGLQD